MADVQIDDGGFTRIANELLEQLPKQGLSGREWDIVMVVIRKTYGFRKTHDLIALSQFCKATGMARSGVQKVIAKLIKRNIIAVNEDKSAYIKCYYIQKDYDQWIPLDKTETKVIPPEPSYKHLAEYKTVSAIEGPVDSKVELCREVPAASIAANVTPKSKVPVYHGFTAEEILAQTNSALNNTAAGVSGDFVANDVDVCDVVPTASFASNMPLKTQMPDYHPLTAEEILAALC